MRLAFLLFLLACFRFSFAQSSLKENLLQDFAKSRGKPYSLHPYWYAEDTISISSRDTITFHNMPQYYFEAGKVCKFLNWSFTSKTIISQSYYFPCVEHGYSIGTSRGRYRFKIKEIGGDTYLKLIDYGYRIRWFRVLRSLEHSTRYKADYPAMTLVRLNHKPA